MKSLLKLTNVVALSAGVLLSGISVLADEGGGGQVRVFDSDATVTFKPGSGEVVEVIPPVTEPDVIVPPIGPPGGNRGPLTIARVPEILDFGEVEISNQEASYSVLAEWFQENNPEGSPDYEAWRPYVSFAQVQDTRGSSNGWNLRMQLSPFIPTDSDSDDPDDSEVLDRVRIWFGGWLEDHESESNPPHFVNDDFYLNAGGSSELVMNADVDEGGGVYSIVWGNQTAIDTQYHDDEEVRNDAIQLIIDGSAVPEEKEYKATLTWTLSPGGYSTALED